MRMAIYDVSPKGSFTPAFRPPSRWSASG